MLLAIAGGIAGLITMLVTTHGFWTYVQEAPARAEQNRLLRLQTVNAAWDTVRSVKGSKSERGQSFALRALVESEIDLSGLDLTHTSIERTSLNKAKLNEANLNGAVLTKVSFDGGGMVGASLREAVLEDVTMDRMEGLPATLENAFVLKTVMSSRLESGLIASAPMDLRGALIVHSTLELPFDKMDFRGSCLVGVAYFVRRSGAEADSDRWVLLREANFAGSVIAGGTFRNAALEGADFRGARFVSPSAFSKKITEIDEATGYRWDTGSAAIIKRLTDAGRLPLCFQRQRELMNVIARIKDVSGDAVTPPNTCCYAQWDADRWLGSGRFTTDFTGASLHGTRFEGADLRATSGINQSALDKACVDDRTQLPPGLRRPTARCLQVIQDDQGLIQSIVYLGADDHGPSCGCRVNPNTLPPSKPPARRRSRS